MKADFDKIGSNIKKGAYQYIGKGSGRVVFDLGNGYVVKAAKNRKGLAQNQAEYIIWSKSNSPLLAKIIDISEDYQLLIMEKAEKVRHISEIWHYFDVNSNRALYQLEELNDIASQFNLVLVDFGRPVNWGTLNGKPVIVDYGFTRQVRKKYY